MHPDLFHIPSRLGEIPVFGFGLLLAVWAAFCVGFFLWLVKRQGLNGDTWSYVPIFAIVAGVILWVLPAICKPDGLPIRGYGVMVLLGVLSGTALANYRARKIGFSIDLLYTAIFWIVVLGILGARIFFVIQYRDEYAPVFEHKGFAAGVIALVNLVDGGLVVYGSFLGGMAGVLIFAKKYRVRILPLLDILAPSMALGVAFGRIGCFFTGCCFGGICHYGPDVQFPVKSPAYENEIKHGKFYGFEITGNEKVAPVFVRSVAKDSLAEKAGLKAGDRLVAIAGYEIRAAGDAHGMLTRQFDAREPVTIETADHGEITLPKLEPPPEHSLAIHPAQIYSSIDAAILCLLMLAYSPFRRRDGELFAILISVYPITRFLIEILRSDEAPIRGTGMSISQNMSLLIILAAAGLWYYLSKQPKGIFQGKPSD
jgi:phosphatidylglycerol:prolipoprotein diacylglycerol transferase